MRIIKFVLLLVLTISTMWGVAEAGYRCDCLPTWGHSYKISVYRCHEGSLYMKETSANVDAKGNCGEGLWEYFKALAGCLLSGSCLSSTLVFAKAVASMLMPLEGLQRLILHAALNAVTFGRDFLPMVGPRPMVWIFAVVSVYVAWRALAHFSAIEDREEIQPRRRDSKGRYL